MFVLGEGRQGAGAVTGEHVEHRELAVTQRVVMALLPDATSDSHECDSEFVI
ncbi:hypothetical protein GCM10009655_16030 [Rhodoglobus aureus]|uniref:Uncharacterized protein n=1 Tax=Rhodoglobus aureus TaxID=191497 RepID=A0ABP4GBN2_9MICO